MRLPLLTGATALLLSLLYSCQSKNKSIQTENSQPESTEIFLLPENYKGGEKQDGINEAIRMEFEKTKDVSLGYVPKSRLIHAVEELKLARMSGTYTNRINALSWTERGSSSDVVGPSNGNGRVSGTQVTSGRMRAIWVDLSDGDNSTVWIGGVAGGLWRTTDITAGPASWTLVNDFLGNLAIADICQSPANNNIMYFGTGEKSPNFDAVQGGGVWKSTNGGTTWSLLPSTVSFWNVSKVVCDPSNANIVYVATISPSLVGIQRSVDGGTTWTNITPTGLNSSVTEMEISSTGRLHIVCGYAGGFYDANPSGYRFTDAPSTVTSGTWTAPTVSFTSTAYNVDIATSGSTLYALPASSSYQTPQVWKSTDGGDNWAITGTTPPTGGSAPVSSGQAWYNLAIGVDPTNADNVMVGGLNSYRSTNGGTTWALNSVWVTGVPGSTNYIHADHHVIVWNNNQVLDGGDGGIFYSADDGATWADRNVGLRLKQFYACAIHPTSTNYFLGGTQDNGVHQLNTAGIGSSTEVTGGDGAFVHIDEDEPQYQFGSYVYNQYRRSTNSGATWANANFSSAAGQFINPTDYDDVTNGFYAAWTAGNYMHWPNAPTSGGASTRAVAAFGGGTVNYVGVSKYTANRVYFGTTNGRVVRVDNANTAGFSATNITGTGMNTTNVSCVAQGTTENNLLATFSNYGAIHVWVSTVGGGAAGWTNITGTGLPDIPVRWAMFYPEDNTQAILATDMGIYETSLINGASTVWVQNSTLPPTRVDMLQYRYSDNTFLAATHGRGMWTSTITPAQAFVRFASSYSYNEKTEATTTTTGCRRYTDYTVNMHIDRAPVGTATVTLNISGGATATQGVDYDFTTNGDFTTPSNVITFLSGATTPQPITIRIYNDAEVESTTPEQFTFNYVISGTTDAVAAPSSSSYVFTVVEPDVAPTTTTVETTLNNNITEHLGNNGTYYFYSSGVNRLMNSITAASGSLACVSSNIYEAGTTWQTFEGGQRSQKVFEIIPTTNTGSTYTIALYFTNAELAGKLPGSLRIAKTTAATMATANATNTVVVSTSNAVYNGTNTVFTASFTGFSKFFLVDDLVALPVDLVSFSGYLDNNDRSVLQWKTANQVDFDRFEVERSYDGVQFTKAGTVPALQNPAPIQDYSFNDPVIAKAVNFYRLKLVDIDGRFKYSAIVKITNSKPKKFVELVQNPVRDNIAFILDNQDRENVSAQLFSSTGQLMKRWELGKVEGYVVLPFNGARPGAGIYILRLTAGVKTDNLRIAIQ